MTKLSWGLIAATVLAAGAGAVLLHGHARAPERPPVIIALDPPQGTGVLTSEEIRQYALHYRELSDRLLELANQQAAREQAVRPLGETADTGAPAR